MTRHPLSLASYLSLLMVPDPTLGCMVDAPPDALADSGISSIGTPIEVRHYPGTGEGDGFCVATLDLRLSSLPSLSLVPRPRELADALVPVAKAYGAKTCQIAVFVYDDVHPDGDGIPTEDACRHGEYRFQGSSWSEIEEDSCYGD